MGRPLRDAYGYAFPAILQSLMYNPPWCITPIADGKKSYNPMGLYTRHYSRAAQILGGPTGLGSKIRNLYTMYRVFF